MLQVQLAAGADVQPVMACCHAFAVLGWTNAAAGGVADCAAADHLGHCATGQLTP